MALNDHGEGLNLDEENTNKLIMFHDITKIDNFERCKEILAQHNWNVNTAVLATFNLGPTPETPDSNVQSVTTTPTVPRQMFTTPPTQISRDISTRFPPSLPGRTPGANGFLDWVFMALTVLTSPVKIVCDQAYNWINFVWRLIYPDPRELITDAKGDVQSFIDDFKVKYPQAPPFIADTYKEAEKLAKKDLKILLIYLHDPSSSSSDAFCSSTLCHSSLSYLFEEQIFYIWACSITKPEGFRVLKMLRRPRAPFLGVACLYRNQMTIVARFSDQLIAEELLVQLNIIRERYEPELAAARADRETLQMNQLIRQQQDEAYRQSLEVDRQRMEEKRLEEEKLKKKEAEKQRKLEERAKLERDHVARRERCRKNLPEATCGSTPGCIRLRIKTPGGCQLNRVFHEDDSVAMLHDFVCAQEGSLQKFQLVKAFPRQEIIGCCTPDVDEAMKSGCKMQTLKESGVLSNEVLVVESLMDVESSDDEQDIF